jgi:hypothetical protein
LIRLDCRQRVGERPARVGIYAYHHVVADRFAHGRKIADVVAPAAAVRHLQAQHLDAELIHRAPGLRDDDADVVRHADRPFKWYARLTAAAQQVVEWRFQRFAGGIVQGDIEHGARGGIAGEPVVEHCVDGFEIENRFAEQRGPVNFLDRGKDAGRSVGDEVAGADRPHLRAADHAVGVYLHEHMLAEQAVGGASIVSPARKDALQAFRQCGDENFYAIDHDFPSYGLTRV